MAEFGVMYVCDRLDLTETTLLEAVELDIHKGLPAGAFNVQIKWFDHHQFGTTAAVRYEMEAANGL
jgi:hypothetical protein